MSRQSDTTTALCADDRCPWKHRGVTPGRTWNAAIDHNRDTGHGVKIYEGHELLGTLPEGKAV